MCGLCPDVIAGCDKIECGALSRLDENGNPRRHWYHWFGIGETPCEHVLAEHQDRCAIRHGDHCDCYWDD